MKNTIHLDDGNLKLAAAVLDPSAENRMTVQDLLEAYPRFIQMIQAYFSGSNASDVAGGFEAHFTNLKNRHEFWSETRLVVEFDIHIRRRFLQEPFNPAIWQENVWNAILAEHLLAIARRPNGNSSALPIASRDFRATNPRSDLSARAPFPAQGGFGAPFRYRSPGRAGATNSFPRRDGDLAGFDSLREGRCFICGVSGHLGKSCRAFRAPFLVKSRTGVWETPSHSQICYAFNNPPGCRIGSCQRPHCCSLCGAPGHSAQRCNAV